jgi:pimeloyl-ACP methyl ester carboxylesterase
MRRIVLATILFALLLATTAFPQGNRPETTSLGGPLRLRDQGSFYVNGKVTGPSNAEVVLNQMYVQYWIPETRGALPPVIMVHGSSHTGKTYETTPDGREGWATYFVRQQIPVYVVDLPGRGRSGFDASSTPRGPLRGFDDQRAWVSFRIGPTPFEPYPTTQFPVEAREQYFAQLVPNGEATLATPRVAQTDGLIALLDKIGPAIVMVHSMSGAEGIRASVARPNLVKALVSVEALSCDATDADVAKTFNTVSVLAVWGDFKDAFIDRGLAACGSLVTRAKAAGGKAKLLHLPEEGIAGNSHMLMMDRNNLKVADRIIAWLRETVK